MKKYILWIDYGSEWWIKEECDTLQECLLYEKHWHEFIITKEVLYDITEK